MPRVPLKEGHIWRHTPTDPLGPSTEFCLPSCETCQDYRFTTTGGEDTARPRVAPLLPLPPGTGLRVARCNLDVLFLPDSFRGGGVVTRGGAPTPWTDSGAGQGWVQDSLGCPTPRVSGPRRPSLPFESPVCRSFYSEENYREERSRRS